MFTDAYRTLSVFSGRYYGQWTRGVWTEHPSTRRVYKDLYMGSVN